MKKIALLVATTSLALNAAPAFAAVLASNTTVEGTSSGTSYNYGQSFTVAGSGSFDNIAINLYRNSSPFANGQLYLFSSAYTGTPSQLANATANRLGVASAANNLYTFTPTVALTGGSQYFFYTDNLDFEINYNSSRYLGGGASQTRDRTAGFGEVSGADLNFRVSGDAVTSAVPEPATWAMMMIGFGIVGAALRRTRQIARVSFV